MYTSFPVYWSFPANVIYVFPLFFFWAAVGFDGALYFASPALNFPSDPIPTDSLSDSLSTKIHPDFPLSLTDTVKSSTSATVFPFGSISSDPS